MDKCATGVCVPVASWMENKPLLIGIGVVIFALIVGGFFLWRSRSGASSSAPEPQVEEFVGRQQEDFQPPQPQAAPEAAEEHAHEE